MQTQNTEDGVPQRSISPWAQLAILLVLSLGVRLALAPVLMNTFDRQDYISTAHKAMKYGIAGYYEPSPDYRGVKNEGGLRGVPLPYPPIQIYSYDLIGHVYQRFFDSTFYDHTFWRELPFDSLALNYLIKVPLFVFELLLTAVIFIFVRGRRGDRAALVCAALYALNPAVLYDGSLWAQPDSIHCTFLVLAVIFLIERRPVAALPLLALALLSKPQPAVFVPIALLLVLISSPLKQVVTAALASVGTALLVLLPMLLQDSRSIPNMLSVMSRVNPYVSANAHNFWWLVVSLGHGDPARLKDSTVVFWGISYFALAMSILALLYAGATAGIIRKAREHIRAEHFAFIGLMFFMFGVRMHENHAMQVLPLLLLSSLMLGRQRVIFGVLSVTILANMLLHSPEVTGEPASRLIEAARLINAAANVVVFGFWSYELYREFRESKPLVTNSDGVQCL
jgi:dolichyl-phosphate-mannose-protein mannosyltransferase